MAENRPYSTRSSAIAAARSHCRKLLGPVYDAYEGPDFEIHPVPEDKAIELFPNTWWRGYGGPSYYRLRGPAADRLQDQSRLSASEQA